MTVVTSYNPETQEARVQFYGRVNERARPAVIGRCAEFLRRQAGGNPAFTTVINPGEPEKRHFIRDAAIP